MSIEYAFIMEPNNKVSPQRHCASAFECHTTVTNHLPIVIPLPCSPLTLFHEGQIDLLLVHHNILTLVAISILAFWLLSPAESHCLHPMPCCLDCYGFLMVEVLQHLRLAHAVNDILCQHKLPLGLKVFHNLSPEILVSENN